MKTKELIIETAKDLISEVGYHKTTTANLAKRANISEGTIYRHFESKEDILTTILKELDRKYAEFVNDIREAGLCTVDNILNRHFQFVEQNNSDIKIMIITYMIMGSSRTMMESIVNRLRNFFAECIEAQKKNGLVREDVPAEQSSWILLLLLFALTRAKLYWPDIGDLSEEAVNFCRRSLLKDA